MRKTGWGRREVLEYGLERAAAGRGRAWLVGVFTMGKVDGRIKGKECKGIYSFIVFWAQNLDRIRIVCRS